MRKGFLIVFDGNQPTKEQIRKFHTDLTNDPDVLGWWHHIANTYIIITTQKANVTTIREFTTGRMPNTFHLILQIRSNNYDGWLPQKAWDWFKTNLNNI
jgi:hypothetical protein